MEIKKLELGGGAVNCYIVSDGADAVVIDPGFEAELVAEYLEKNGLHLHYIFLTHGHYDHILAVPALKEMTGAQLVISEQDADYLVNPERSLAKFVRMQQQPCTADILAHEGSIFNVGGMEFRWMITPGHTKGSSVIACGRSLFTGDTLFRDTCGRCDFPGGSYDEMLQSLKRIAEFEGDYDVYAGHMEDTTLSRERRYNMHVKEAMGI